MSEEEKKEFERLKLNNEYLQKDCNSLKEIIDKQQKEIEELKIKNKKIGEINYRANKNLLELEETSIRKYKLREKIKELENLQENQYIHLDYTKKILEELLEE